MSLEPEFEDDPEDWLVFADALQASGDPRGELIALNHALQSGATDDPRARDAFVKAHAQRLLGPLHRWGDALRPQWWWTLFSSARLEFDANTQPGLIDALLGAPQARALERLEVLGRAAPDKVLKNIYGSTRVEQGPTLNLVAELEALHQRGLPPRCTELSLVDEKAARSRYVIETYFDPPENQVQFGELHWLWARCPQLRSLQLSVSDGTQVELGTIHAPSLEHFRLDCLTWNGNDVLPESILMATWPKLRSFALRLPECWVGSIPDREEAYTRPYQGRASQEHNPNDEGSNRGFNWQPAVAAILQNLHSTRLKRLALTSFASTRGVLAAIHEVGLPAGLEELDLSDSSLGERDAEQMIQHEGMYASLKRLVLKRTSLSSQTAELLSLMGPQVLHSQGDGARYRFLVGAE